MNDHHDPTAGNIAVIRGSVRTEPTMRELPSGGVVVQFDVTTTITATATATESGERQLNVSVPIAWNDPTPTQLGVLAAGAEVLIVGTVRRRFFRVAGATQSRTEVNAEAVVPTRQRKRVARALREAADRVLDVAA
jgi:single-strand DNA-binding protein